MKISRGQEQTGSWWQWILEAGPGVCARRYRQDLWVGSSQRGGQTLYQASASCRFSLCRSELFPISFWQRMYLQRRPQRWGHGLHKAGHCGWGGVSAQGDRIAMSLPSGCLEPFSGGFLDARLAFSTDSIGFLFFSQGRSWEGKTEADAFKPELLEVTSKQAGLVHFLARQAREAGQRRSSLLSFPQSQRLEGWGLGWAPASPWVASTAPLVSK